MQRATRAYGPAIATANAEEQQMATMIVRHRVANFEAWKKVFDSMHDVRIKEYNWLGTEVLRDENDPNYVTVIDRVKDVASAKRYGGSQALHDAMQKAGVISAPDVTFMNEVEAA